MLQDLTSSRPLSRCSQCAEKTITSFFYYIAIIRIYRTKVIEWLLSFKRTKKMRREKITVGLFCLMSSSFRLITVLCCVVLYCFELN